MDARDAFLQGLWSYWLVVGIALRHVRKGAGAEKTTTILKQLWEERAQFSEREFGDALGGYWPERDALWMRRNAVRELLVLPREQFADDDAVNIFYSGQAFHNGTTKAVGHQKVRDWWLAGVTSVGVKVPANLRAWAADELHLDVNQLAFPGWYFSGYDDATIWIGRVLDEQVAHQFARLSPGDRALRFQGEAVSSLSPEEMLLEPLLREALRAASTAADHRSTRALIEQTVGRGLFPASLVPNALSYLLFVQTPTISTSLALIRAVIAHDWSAVPAAFDEQRRSNVQRAREALILFCGALHAHALHEECTRLLRELPVDLLDADTLLGILRQMIPRSRTDGGLLDHLVQTLAASPTCTPLHHAEMNYHLAILDICSNKPSS